MTACTGAAFQTLQEKVPKLSEDQVVESFGEADAFLDTCQLLKGFLWFSAAQLSFKALHGKVITEGNISDQ